MYVRAVAVVLFLAAGVIPSVAASAQEVGGVEERVAEPLERASATGARTTFEGWGKFSVNGSFSQAQVLPGTRSAVALNVNRLARYDLDTNEFLAGPVVPGIDLQVFPSAEGSWVWTAENVEVESGAASELRIRRYRTDDLTLESTFVYEMGTVDGAVAQADPTNENRLVVFSEGDFQVVEDGVRLPGILPTRYRPEFGRFVVTPSGFVVALVIDSSDGFFDVFEYGDSGIVAVTEISFEATASLLPDGFVIGSTITSLPGFEQRPATSFDLAIPDPDLDIRFGEFMYDGTTGNVLPPARPCTDIVTQSDPTLPRLQLIGGGWKLDDDLTFTNLLDRCGSYGEFTPVQPDRVFDSRPGNGELGEGEPLRGGEIRRIGIHGLGGVPVTGVESVVLNVTAVNQRDAGLSTNYVTVWPAGFEQPTVANLNVANGETVGNMVTVSTASGGFVDVYSNAGEVDLTVDVVGYFSSAIAPPGARLLSFRPIRQLDTRVDGNRVGEGQRLRLDVIDGLEAVLERYANRSVTRSEVSGVVMAVTAVQPSERGFFRISPGGAPTPDASAMNFDRGTNTNRLVTVELNGGEVDIVNELGTTHLTIDIVGFYVERGTTARYGVLNQSGVLEQADFIEQNGRFVGYVPFRAVDTRVNSPFDGDGRIPENFQLIQGGWGIGSTLVTNLTAIRPTETGFFSTIPTGPITSSSLNFGPGDIVANQALIPVSDDGEISVFNSAGLAHFTLDVFGVYTETDADAQANQER